MSSNNSEIKSPKKKSMFKKILIGLGVFLGLLILLSILFPIDYYKNGVDYYNKGEYAKAYEYLSNVKQDDVNYNDAISRIKELKPIVDSLELIEQSNKDAKNKSDQAMDEQKKSEKESKKALKENPYLEFPKEQQNFIIALDRYKEDYSKAENELKKSVVRTKRGEEIKTILGNKRNFNGWFGEVKGMKTTSNGKAYFSVVIKGTGIEISNMNNEFSDMFENTLIEQTNPLYPIIAELKIGDLVKVSGTFLKSNKVDFIYESSLTEEGSMESPDFIGIFTGVTK